MVKLEQDTVQGHFKLNITLRKGDFDQRKSVDEECTIFPFISIKLSLIEIKINK